MSKPPAVTSVTRLLSLGLTPGKLLGLQRISNPNGTFTMLALDQNSSIVKMASQARQRRGQTGPPPYEEIVEAKCTMTRFLGPEASAVLLDGPYGAWQAVASGALPRQAGLLVRLEQSGSPTMDDPLGGKLSVIEPGWSVGQIKRMGAQAVKFLIPVEPTHGPSAERQMTLLQEVHAECRRHDILLLLETLSYPFKGEDKTDPRYLERKPFTVIETARLFSPWCDVYKAEFPGVLGYHTDAQLVQHLSALDQACQRPWVLLSAGVDYDDFEKQVRLAVQAGASGVLGGRAFWKEYFDQDTPADRERFCQEVARPRLAAVHAIVQRDAQPWFRRYGLNEADFRTMSVAEGWYWRYPAAEGMPSVADSRPGPVDRTGPY